MQISKISNIPFSIKNYNLQEQTKNENIVVSNNSLTVLPKYSPNAYMLNFKGWWHEKNKEPIETVKDTVSKLSYIENPDTRERLLADLWMFCHADKIDVNTQDKAGNTILMVVKSPEEFSPFTQMKLDYLRKDYQNRTPIMYSVINTKSEDLTNIFCRMAERQTERENLDFESFINSQDNSTGYTALMLSNTAEQTLVLLDYGADPSMVAQDGQTALSRAKTVEQTKVLLNSLKRIKNQEEFKRIINARDIEGQTALMKASTQEQTKVLLAAGADPYITDNLHHTAWNYATEGQKFELDNYTK